MPATPITYSFVVITTELLGIAHTAVGNWVLGGLGLASHLDGGFRAAIGRRGCTLPQTKRNPAARVEERNVVPVGRFLVVACEL